MELIPLLESELIDPPSVERLRGCVDARGSPGFWGFHSSERGDFEEEVQDLEEVQDFNEIENVEENEDLEELEGIDEILDSNTLRSPVLITKKKTWTDEEKKAFNEGFKKFGKKWKKIKNAYPVVLGDRTSTTIKDFWRNHAVDGARAPKIFDCFSNVERSRRPATQSLRSTYSLPSSFGIPLIIFL